MAIGGKTRKPIEEKTLKVGFGEFDVILVNPTREEYKEVLGMELKEESKADEYLGEKDGNITLRLDFWGKNTKTGEFQKSSFFLEDKSKENKDATKKQYISATGSTSWADDPNNLPDWFKKGDNYRVAYVGEEEMYGFLRNWLGKLDFKDPSVEFSIEWKPLMKGNVKELKALINGAYSTPFLWLLEVKTVEKDGETKSYQSVYNKGFLPSYCLKQFRLVDYNKVEEQNKIKLKKPKEQKIWEKLVLQVTGEYGTKNFTILKDLQDYDPSMNIVASNEPISADGSDY